MSITVKDLIASAKVGNSTGGLSATRIFQVDGLTSEGHKRLYDAITAPGIPIYGEAHPSVPLVFAQNIEAQPLSNSPDQAMVTVQYGKDDGVKGAPDDTKPPVWSFSSTLQDTKTNVDKDGDLLVVAYVHQFDDGTVSSDPAQVAEITFQQPMLMIRGSRREPGSPYFKARRFVGAVNADDFQGDVPGMWMCSRIDGETTDGGASYNVTYEFIRNPNGWKQQIVWLDKKTNAPPTDIEEGNGLEFYEVYGAENFSDLGVGQL